MDGERSAERSARDRSRAAEQDELRAVMAAWGRHHAALGAETARFFLDLDLTMAQLRALGAVRRWGRLTGRGLAARLGVTPGTIVPLCDRLEEQGYLRRVPDPSDRRLTWLELTPAGEELFRRLWLAGGEKVMRAVARFTPADRRTLGRLLNQIADYLESESPPVKTRRRRAEVHGEADKGGADERG
jgi:DNA-binding MarR family transcriptional regulator